MRVTIASTMLLLTGLIAAPLQAADATSAAPAAPAAPPAAVAARAAQDFVDSVGVCVHLGRISEPYFTQFPLLKERILDSGIRHLRTDMSLDPRVIAHTKELAREGVRFDFILQCYTSFKGPEVEPYLACIKENFADCTDYIEGTNEPSPKLFGEGARKWMQQIYQQAKQDPVLKKIPVLGAPLGHPKGGSEIMGDWSAFVDVGNIHAYPSQMTPEVSMPLYIGYVQPMYPNLKYAVTETGYHNGTHSDPKRMRSVSQEVEAIYMPRLYLEHFRLGLERSYKYQFADDWTEQQALTARPPVQFAHFGLVDYYLRPRAAYYAIRNLQNLLQDAGPAFAPGQLKYAVTVAPDDLHQVLLQKRNGDFFLALWRAVSVWDGNNVRNLQIEDAPLEVQLVAPAKSVKVFYPSRWTNVQAAEEKSNVAKLPLTLGGDVAIVQISP